MYLTHHYTSASSATHSGVCLSPSPKHLLDRRFTLHTRSITFFTSLQYRRNAYRAAARHRAVNAHRATGDVATNGGFAGATRWRTYYDVSPPPTGRRYGVSRVQDQPWFVANAGLGGALLPHSGLPASPALYRCTFMHFIHTSFLDKEEGRVTLARGTANTHPAGGYSA